MKTLKDDIFLVLRKALLKGELDNLDSELIAREYKQSKMNGTIQYRNEKIRLLKLLTDEKDETLDRRNKLNHPDLVNSFGEYVQLFLTEHEVSQQNICEAIALKINILKDVIRNSISVIKVEPGILAKLGKLVDLSSDNSIQLIIKSLKLFEMKSANHIAMARYDSKKGKSKKGISMNHGIEEILLKASESEPLNSNGNIEKSEEFALYLDEFKKAYL